MTRDIFTALLHQDNIVRMWTLKIIQNKTAGFIMSSIPVQMSCAKQLLWIWNNVYLLRLCGISVYYIFNEQTFSLDVEMTCWTDHDTSCYLCRLFLQRPCGSCCLMFCFLRKNKRGKALGTNGPILSGTQAPVLPNSSLFFSTAPLCLARNTERYLHSARGLALFF